MKPWRKDFLVLATAVVAAIAATAAVNKQPLYNIKFHLGLYDHAAVRENIEQTLRQFNRDFATLFNTSGPTAILAAFPADNLVKRRIFQEVNFWDGKNMVMVYDKDTFAIEKIELPLPGRAVVVAREIWYISAQDAVTRRRVSTLKRNTERVRYLMQMINGKWRVMEYEIYGEKDSIPARVGP
jgi:hypothetical protein